ncbi:hypothetical protein CDIK_2003 [Cucumispora dikerogammari]|nr:hypothetical protein CDIK_2003 [Cucumispora dikerogammari]
MRFKLFDTFFHDKTIIEIVFLPFHDINQHLKQILDLKRTIILDCTGDFYLNIHNKNKTLFVYPSYKEMLKIIKYLDLKKYNLLIINNWQTFINKQNNSFYIKKCMNKLWATIYEHEITILIINGYERRAEKLVSKYENILNKLISYRVLVYENETVICKFEMS